MLEENGSALDEAGNSNMSTVTLNTVDAAAQPTSQSNWIDNLSDENKKLVETKGWKSQEDLIKSYSELEKHASAKISIPKDDDAEGLGKLYSRLGKPETADQYELKDVLDRDKPFVETFKSAAHEANLTNKQVERLYNWFKSSADKTQEEVTEQFNKQSDADIQSVREEWGENYAKNEETLKRGWRMLSLPEDKMRNIELSIGTKDFMKIGLAIGSAISEDNPIGLGGGSTKSEAMSTEDYIKEQFAKANSF